MLSVFPLLAVPMDHANPHGITLPVNQVILPSFIKSLGCATSKELLLSRRAR